MLQSSKPPKLVYSCTSKLPSSVGWFVDLPFLAVPGRTLYYSGRPDPRFPGRVRELFSRCDRGRAVVVVRSSESRPYWCEEVEEWIREGRLVEQGRYGDLRLLVCPDAGAVGTGMAGGGVERPAIEEGRPMGAG